MVPFRIAIVGSCAPERADELKLKNVELSQQAGEDLGQALAHQGFNITVYASDNPYYLEVSVVRGYLKVDAAGPNTIQVMYSDKSVQPRFEQQKPSDERFMYLPDADMNWETSFYRSIAEVDGILLLGGGNSTLIAGLVAMSHKKPILAVGAFGGAALKVREVLISQDYPLEGNELAQMATMLWSSERAEMLIDLLKKQIDRFAARKQVKLAREQAIIEAQIKENMLQRREINMHVGLAFLCFVLGSLAWPLALALPDQYTVVLVAILLLSSLSMGAAGAAILVILNSYRNLTQAKVKPMQQTALLGMAAGGASAFLFIIAQAYANPLDVQAVVSGVYRRLVPFAIVIGLVAGLTFEVVFGRLSSINVVQTGPIQAPAQQANVSTTTKI